MLFNCVPPHNQGGTTKLTIKLNYETNAFYAISFSYNTHEG